MSKLPVCSALAVALAGLLVTACTSLSGAGAELQPDTFAIERGREIAQFHCASCHQIGASGASPSLMAPPFHSIYISYSRLAFKKAVEEASGEHGYSMPGYDLNRTQVDDLVAYLESVRRASPRG